MPANHIFPQVSKLPLRSLPSRVHEQYGVDTDLKDSGPGRVPGIPETAFSLPFIQSWDYKPLF